MKAVVFGGSGFLGSHVADALTERGHDTVVFDKKESPYIRSGQSMLVGDIMDRDGVAAAVKGADYVYNFAGIADLDDATTKPLDTISLNIAGAIHILDACVAAKIRRLVHASTIYVYSQKGGFYRCSKQSAELYIEEYGRRFGLGFTVLRYGTLYGPRAGRRNSVHRYLQEAMDTGRITGGGHGGEMREYIHVRDAARLSVDILQDEYANKHIIVTGHHPLRFKDMLLIIQEILQKKVQIEFTAEQNPDHYEYTPYSFAPKIGHKLVANQYIDLGQGLLECLHEMYGNSR